VLVCSRSYGSAARGVFSHESALTSVGANMAETMPRHVAFPEAVHSCVVSIHQILTV
jgi:hypothetical protein